MSAYSEQSLAARFGALVPETARADWLDVQRRLRRRGQRRRRLVVAAAAAIAVLVAGSALALGPRIVGSVDFSSATPSPPEVVDFLTADRPVRTYLDPSTPEYDPASARSVLTADIATGSIELHAAPLAGGGFCVVRIDRLTVAQGHGATCQAADELRRAPLTAEEPEGRSYDAQGRQTGATSLVGWTAIRADRLEVRYEDGAPADVPYVWVTAPIRAGFFASGIASGRGWAYGASRATELVALDADGRTLARLPITYDDRDGEWAFVPRYGPAEKFPPAADASRIQILRFPGSNGTLQIAPAKEGARCFLLHYDDTTVANCLRDPDDWKLSRIGTWPFLNPSKGLFSEPRPAGGTGPVLFGIVDPGVERVELVFQNGDREVLSPRESFVLYQTTRDHFAPGTRLAEVRLLDADGHLVRRAVLAPETRGIYPCRNPKRLHKDVFACP